MSVVCVCATAKKVEEVPHKESGSKVYAISTILVVGISFWVYLQMHGNQYVGGHLGGKENTPVLG